LHDGSYSQGLLPQDPRVRYHLLIRQDGQLSKTSPQLSKSNINLECAMCYYFEKKQHVSQHSGLQYKRFGSACRISEEFHPILRMHIHLTSSYGYRDGCSPGLRLPEQMSTKMVAPPLRGPLRNASYKADDSSQTPDVSLTTVSRTSAL